MKEPVDKYKKYIDLPHHVSSKYPHISLYDRSAQFAPFAALTGYEELIEEEGRLTSDRIEINEEAKFQLDVKMQRLMERASQMPLVSITYFVPDEKKNGGKYVTLDEEIKKIDILKHVIVTVSSTVIPVDEIVDMQSEIFADLEF